MIEYRDGEIVKTRRKLDRDSRLATLREAHSRRDVLIHTYEDRQLLGPDSTQRGELFGCSESFHDVLVVRDPLNFFASRLQRWSCLSGIKDRQELVALWKQHAAEALGMTARIGPGRIVANFTRWAVDGDYREELARALGLTFSDNGRDSMMPGFSSSFDGTGYRTRADAMLVNERWNRPLPRSRHSRRS